MIRERTPAVVRLGEVQPLDHRTRAAIHQEDAPVERLPNLCDPSFSAFSAFGHRVHLKKKPGRQRIAPGAWLFSDCFAWLQSASNHHVRIPRRCPN